MRVITVDLFSGMGGFALASHWMGWETAIICEIDDNCKVVLAHHFPGAYIHGDIHTLTGKLINEEIEKRYGPGWRDTTRLICQGGFPCQPYSAAGKRLGKEDSRHLWPEMLRVIQECRPDAIVGENVSGIVSWDGGLVFEEVQTDLEAEGYEVQAVVVPACSVGAPHRRDRVWFVAQNSNIYGCKDVPAKGKPDSKGFWVSKPTNSGTISANNEDIERPLTHDNRNMGGGGKAKGKSEFPHDQVCLTTHPRLPESQGRDEVEEGQQHGGWRLAWSQLASFGGAWPFAYATGKGLEGCEWSVNEGGRKRLAKYAEDGYVADTNDTRLQGGKEQGGIGGSREGRNEFSTRSFLSKWDQFPTEPPLRVGDDGISARLGRVCLPGTKRKLTESAVNKMGLKMAGNAVVPQVVFQIFKALEATWK